MFDKFVVYRLYSKIYLLSYDFLCIGGFLFIYSVDIGSMNGYGLVNNFIIEDIEFDVGICLVC